jgi:hypothetical protein
LKSGGKSNVLLSAPTIQKICTADSPVRFTRRIFPRTAHAAALSLAALRRDTVRLLHARRYDEMSRPSSTTAVSRLIALSAGAAIAAGCTSEPTRPDAPHSTVTEAAQPTAPSSLALGAELRGQLQAALLFAGTQSRLALKQRDAADRVDAAFTRLAAAVDADDRAELQRAIVSARSAVTRYRELATATNDPSAAVDLASMDLTLERAAALVTTPPTSTQEHEP